MHSNSNILHAKNKSYILEKNQSNRNNTAQLLILKIKYYFAEYIYEE